SGLDAERAADAPLLATIPRMNGRRSAGPLFLRTAPHHAASEQGRALALHLRSVEGGPSGVVVGGADPEAGRSTVAANVALALGRLGARAALLDADLRGGTLDRWFGRREARGWPSLITEGADPLTSAQRVEDGAAGGVVDLFAAGSVELHPLEVLATPGVPAFIDRLRASYDVVVVDTPALATGHDASVRAGLADGTVLVARAQRTGEQELTGAADAFRRSGAVLGVVLTAAAD